MNNAPNKGDYEKARVNPKEASHPRFTVFFSNPGASKVKVKVKVSLESPEGKTLLSCDTKEKLLPGAKDFESGLCFLASINVVDWPKATMHVVISK